MTALEDGTHDILEVRQLSDNPGTDVVILAENGLPWFRTDHGELSDGDRVRVEDGRYAGVAE